MASLRALLLFVVVLVAACTQTATPADPIPTQAVLDATAAPTTQATPTVPNTATPDTRIVTQQAELVSTLAAVQATQTALAAMPVAQSTDCGASTWWNYAGGSAIDALRLVSGVHSEVEALPPTPEIYGMHFTIASSYADSIRAITNDIAERDYPLCIKDGRDGLLAALDAYHEYVLGYALSLSETLRENDDYDPEALAADLADARVLMRAAASEIQHITGADTSALLDDGLDKA